MSMFDDVGDFHEKFGLVRVGRLEFRRKGDSPPHSLSKSDFGFRANFLQEELEEFYDAYNQNDLPKMADALADIVWVALGTAHLMHVPLDAVWAEVRRANMEKERATGADDPRSTRKHKLDIVKPASWRPPDVAKVLRDHGWKL